MQKDYERIIRGEGGREEWKKSSRRSTAAEKVQALHAAPELSQCTKRSASHKGVTIFSPFSLFPYTGLAALRIMIIRELKYDRWHRSLPCELVQQFCCISILYGSFVSPSVLIRCALNLSIIIQIAASWWQGWAFKPSAPESMPRKRLLTSSALDHHLVNVNAAVVMVIHEGLGSFEFKSRPFRSVYILTRGVRKLAIVQNREIYIHRNLRPRWKRRRRRYPHPSNLADGRLIFNSLRLSRTITIIMIIIISVSF